MFGKRRVNWLLASEGAREREKPCPGKAAKEEIGAAGHAALVISGFQLDGNLLHTRWRPLPRSLTRTLAKNRFKSATRSSMLLCAQRGAGWSASKYAQESCLAGSLSLQDKAPCLDTPDGSASSNSRTRLCFPATATPCGMDRD